MNMENAFQMPKRVKKEDDSLMDVSTTERDAQKEGQRNLKNAADFLEESRSLTRQYMEESRKPNNEEKTEEIRRGMALVRNLAEQQMALAASEEDKEILKKSINLIENNM